MKQSNKINCWDVRLEGEFVDTVWYPSDISKDNVYNALMGKYYDPDITVALVGH